MGLGKMTIPLYLTAVPEGMSFKIEEISENVPSSFWSYISWAQSLPHTFHASDVKEGLSKSYKGAKIADLYLATGGWGLHGGQGGSFLVKFTITGQPIEHPEAPALNTKGTLSIGTSEWGVFSRPDQTNFIWQIGEKQQTFTAKTPTLSYLDDSCIALSWVKDDKTYVLGVSNEQSFLEKVAKGAVSGIIAGHKLVWSKAAGTVLPIGGAVFGVIAFGASYVDGL